MTHEPAHILVVDDDTRLRELLSKYLAEQGYRVTTAADAAVARTRMSGLAFDLLVLDIMMPGESGLELCESLSSNGAVPILLLSAMNEPGDRIAGLEQGADDYLPKPFEPRELVLRIEAILRRTQRQLPVAPDQVLFGDYSFDLRRQELRKGDSFIRLTTAEACLLKALAERAGEPVDRQLLSESQQPAAGSSRTIDVQVTRLRRKIEDDPKFPRYLQTVRGTGYVLVADRTVAG